MYKQGSPVTTQSPKTLEPNQQLHARLDAYVIAQQYPPTTFVSLGFHPRKDKSGAFKIRCFFPVFSLLILLKTVCKLKLLNFHTVYLFVFNKLKNKQIVYICRQIQQYIYSFVFIILMATHFVPSDHHLAILQKLNLRYIQCS